MQTIILRLKPDKLSNPDLDIRYVLPDLLVKESDSLIVDDGYDYENYEINETNPLLLYLQTTDLAKALCCIKNVIENIKVLGNDSNDAVDIIVE